MLGLWTVLCVFAPHVPHTTSRALSSEDGPRKDFTAFMEWTLPESTPASGSTSAPSSLASTVTRLSISSTWVLSHSGSAADLWISTSVTRALGSTLAPRILGIHLACWLSALGSSTTCYAAVGRPPLESAAIPPPLLLHPSAPPWAIIWLWPGSAVLLLLRPLLSPPWLLSPSSPPWTLSSPPHRLSFLVLSSSLVPTRPPLWMFPTVRGRTFGRGRLCQVYGLVCVLLPMCSVTQFRLQFIVIWFRCD